MPSIASITTNVLGRLVVRLKGGDDLVFPHPNGLVAKNYFINGGFDFAQRSTATIASPASVGAYNTVDRWRNAYTGGTWTLAPLVKREISSPNTKTKNSFRWQSNASVGGSGVNLFSTQRIESHLARELVAAGTFSISVWVASQSCTTLRCELRYPGSEDNFTTPTVYSTTDKAVSNNGAWQLVKFENLPVHASAVNGLDVLLTFTNYAVLNVNADHYLAQAMCNVGPKAQDFVRHAPSLTGELAACQRYYEKSYNTDIAPATTTDAGAVYAGGHTNISTAAFLYAFVRFAAHKRVAPTITTYDVAGTSGRVSHISAGGVGTNNFVMNPGPDAPIAGGFAFAHDGGINSRAAVRFQWTAESEL